MILKKKVSMGMGFAAKKDYEFEGVKYTADIVDGDLVTIKNAGETVAGDFGDRQIFSIETRNGNKALAFNQTSINNLIEAFGEDTKGWVEKKVKVFIIKMMVAGKLQNVSYVAPETWVMSEEGKFFPDSAQLSADDDIDLP